MSEASTDVVFISDTVAGRAFGEALEPESNLVPFNPTPLPEGPRTNEAARDEKEDEHLVFQSKALASRREVWFAVCAVVFSALIFALAAPFAKVPLAHLTAFIPAYQSALVMCDLITAALLLGQFNVLQSRSLLVLASGYLFTAFIAVSLTLTYPDVFSPTGLLGAGPQTAAWLYMFWHAGFPLFVIAYALLEDEPRSPIRADSSEAPPPRGRGHAIVVAVGVIFALVCGLTLVTTTFHDALPVLMLGIHLSSPMRAVIVGIWLLSLAALVVLAFRRPYSTLDVWLMVVMCAWLFDMGLGAVFNTGRFDFGFYAGRVYGLLAASFLLIVLLIETGTHYTRLARTSEALNIANKGLKRRSAQAADDLRRYRGLLEAAPDGMVVVNSDGEIILSNLQAEKLFGFSRDELLGQKVTNIIPDGFVERLIADGLRSDEDALTQQIGAGLELRGRRGDGAGFPIEIMLSPLETSDGRLVTAAIRDITERKASEALLALKMGELNRSNEELEQFAYVASHDLQEPLRMVSSYMQLLSKRYKGKLDSDADEFIAFAEDAATRMRRLIVDLLTYSRIGSTRAEHVSISSERALREALRNLRGAIEDSGALVTHDPLPIVLADELLLTQLFQNLVGNAIKYQRPGIPEIHVAAAADGDGKWTFSVRDNGLGIDPRHFEKIFGMFQRLHKRGEFEGTGIGLAICKKIVERHGGAISVESQPGRGSTFRFALAEGQAA